VSWFQSHDHYGRRLVEDKHAVLCPWVAEHSDQRPAEASDTVVWEASNEQWPVFHCSHAHCINRSVQDVINLWGDADSFCSTEFQSSKASLPPGQITESGYRLASIDDYGPISNGPQNLTSNYREDSLEVRLLDRVGAQELQRRALAGEMPPVERLPFLGNLEASPFVMGWAHLLSGYPKAGKTELVTRLAMGWNQQGVGVLYITEETESVWAARLARLPKSFHNVALVFAMGATQVEIEATIQVGAEQVVIIDTIRLFRIGDENDNSAINKALTPLVALCRAKHQTLVMVHHTRKRGGE
jgi:hypothetical protein